MNSKNEKRWIDVYDNFINWSKVRDFTWLEIRFILANYESYFKVINRNVRNRLSRSGFTTESSMNVNVIVSDTDYLENLMNYLPWYERKSKVYFSLFNSTSLEFRILEQKRLQIENNLYIDRAIESLKYRERDLGIKNTNNLSYRQRREQIISRNISVFDQTNENTIKNICSAYSNGEVDILPHEDIEGLYIIEFIGSLGIPDNILGLKETLELVFPAHLGFDFKYRFVIWDMLERKHWMDLKDLSWEEIKTWKEVIA